ncbi:MAG: hypothetical protein HWD59_09565 [Coxiellaceae bacterium]|nr:MAG: hypothetical protein HWD59_09565 [Coxiellaceae bacterium]
MPNVAIDAMMQALPIICFEKTTGIIEFLEQSAETASCILPFSNITVAAEKILKFYQSPQYYASVADKVQAIALENFDMKQYVERLVELVLDSH